MICEPCREPHTAEQCVDAPPGRIYPWRHCACQHKPRSLVARSEGDAQGDASDR